MDDRSARSGEAGFTLVESLISIVILVFGLLAVTNLMIVAASSNSVGNQSSATTALASERLETLKAIPFTNLSPGGSLTADTSGFFSRDDIDGVGPILTRWQVFQLSGDNQTKFITVRSEPVGGLLRTRARAEFTTFRSCTATSGGCPTP
jgi:type II secretory pathway pseudopilin PulG